MKPPALLKRHGLIKPKDVMEIRVPKKCVRRGILCSAEAEIRSRCSMALTLQAAMKKDDELAETNKRIDHIMELLKGGATPDPRLLNVKSSELK